MIRRSRLLTLVLVAVGFFLTMTLLNKSEPRDTVDLAALPPRISVVVPTYKEVANIDPLCEALFRVAEMRNIDMEVVIVDDDSQDGTVNAVEKIAKYHPLRLAVRKGKKGLSSAVLQGIGLAKHDIIVVMDADLSHPPDRIPSLIEPLVKGTHDFVLGSRYTEGFWVEDWTLTRRIISLGATALAKPLIAGKVTDPMSGFFAIRKDTFLACDKLNPLGFKIALELMVKCHPKALAEVSIVFKDRTRGESKLTGKQQLFYVTHLGRLYFYSFPITVVLVAILGLASLFFIIVWVSRLPAFHRKRKHIKPV